MSSAVIILAIVRLYGHARICLFRAYAYTRSLGDSPLELMLYRHMCSQGEKGKLQRNLCQQPSYPQADSHLPRSCALAHFLTAWPALCSSMPAAITALAPFQAGGTCKCNVTSDARAQTVHLLPRHQPTHTMVDGAPLRKDSEGAGLFLSRVCHCRGLCRTPWSNPSKEDLANTS